MADAQTTGPHLTDAEIDAYWKDEMTPAEEERAEQHYLDCAECRIRVRAVETVIDALHAAPQPIAGAPTSLRFWQMAAALFAALAAGATWQWARLAREPRNAVVTPDRPAVAVAARTTAGPFSTIIVPLTPPTRSAEVIEVSVPADVSLIVFELDVREAGAPGSRFAVTLTDSGGRVLLRLAESVSTPAGTLRVPVERALLRGERFLFDTSAGSSALSIPFLTRPADSR